MPAMCKLYSIFVVLKMNGKPSSSQEGKRRKKKAQKRPRSQKVQSLRHKLLFKVSFPAL